MNIVYCFCGTTFDLTRHVRCPTCHEELAESVTDKAIRDYLFAAVANGTLRATNFWHVGIGQGARWRVHPHDGPSVEYDHDGIVSYVEMLQEAGVQPRSLF